MLSINNIEVIYNKVILVLKGVSVEVPEGKIVALLGANGGGKTTTLKSISGLLRTELGEVSEGNITWDGKRINGLPAHKVVEKGIVQVQEGRMALEHLSAEENLKVGAYSRKDGRAAIARDLDMVYNYFPRVKALRGRISGYLSGGEQQMMVIGRAMMSDPKVMLLDEPSMGLAPLLVKSIFQIVERLNKERNTSILLVEQNAKAALKIADYGYVMENGRIVFDGPSEKLNDNEDIKEFYLGFGHSANEKTYRNVKHYKRRKRWLG
ncbi:MAG: ABC transporter ATP-binding protein [Desulfobacteraceae bacterium 4484_190.1]|nr:MAG: ABC transporter ATP-binding protein [Desulfobacteraceae bacterium 4484_190.1]